MKKFSIILLLVLVSACSNSSENTSSSFSINPPVWIQGTWLYAGSVDSGFKFTSNDLIQITSSYQQQSLVRLFKGTNAIAHETITGNSYNLDIESGGTTLSYHFNKITPAKIEWVSDPMGDLVDYFYIKQ